MPNGGEFSSFLLFSFRFPANKAGVFNFIYLNSKRLHFNKQAGLPIAFIYLFFDYLRCIKASVAKRTQHFNVTHIAKF